MAHVPTHLARLAGAPGRPLASAPRHRAVDTDHAPVAADPEVAATQPVASGRSLGRFVTRLARLFGRLVLVR